MFVFCWVSTVIEEGTDMIHRKSISQSLFKSICIFLSALSLITHDHVLYYKIYKWHSFVIISMLIFRIVLNSVDMPYDLPLLSTYKYRNRCRVHASPWKIASLDSSTKSTTIHIEHIEGLMQKRRNSNARLMELRHFTWSHRYLAAEYRKYKLQHI